mgnify:CR=1 FL=1
MAKIIINGGKTLNGEVKISGEPPNIGSRLVGQTLDEQGVWVANRI